jgi:hypothetical protein
MKNLAAGFCSSKDLLQAIEELEEKLNNLPSKYPNPTRFKSPFHEEEDDNH